MSRAKHAARVSVPYNITSGGLVRSTSVLQPPQNTQFFCTNAIQMPQIYFLWRKVAKSLVLILLDENLCHLPCSFFISVSIALQEDGQAACKNFSGDIGDTSTSVLINNLQCQLTAIIASLKVFEKLFLQLFQFENVKFTS